MKRILPTVDLKGTLFFVDVLHEELRQTSDVNNRIPFDVFEQERDGYTFLYDTIRLNVPEDIKKVKELGDRYQWVTLPALMELDAEGIALKYDIPLHILCPDLQVKKEQEDDEEDYYDQENFF